ncbi:histidine--tRNA ligase [Candidatus Pacearchaeota archaeon]|nr:histidine--tRNA ligase [Candidatus Pacearchaeota archaeon]
MANECVKGFKDYTGEEARIREEIRKILVKNFELFGFEPAEAPIIENEEFVRGDNSNDEAVSDIFRLKDKGERNLALRYELTFQLKRLMQNKKLPYKRYQIGPVFRDEPTTGNRFRQFTQCDIDIIGSSIKDDAEILAITSKILEELGIKAVINVNSRRLMNEILESEGIKEKDRIEVIKEVDKLDKLSEKEVKDNLKKYKAEKLIDIFKKSEKYFEKYASYSDVQQLKEACSNYGIKTNFLPTLARGLSYYNANVFEVKTLEMKESVCGGGSYMFNGAQSTGISFGLERLSQLAKLKNKNSQTLIISLGQDKESIKLAEELRENNLSCVVMYNKVSKALEYANAYLIDKVIFIGEDEIKKKKLKLRDMKTGKEEMLSQTELIKKLSK